MERNFDPITSTSSPDYLFKILMMGDSAVGKTSTIERYVLDSFQGNNFTTIGIDFRIKTLKNDGKIVKLQLWDVVGAERFRSLTSTYYRRADGIFLLYDITKRSTFESLGRYITDIQAYAPKNCRWIILGNKVDKEETSREVSYDEGAEFASKHGVPFFEVSAKSGYGIEEAVQGLVDLMREVLDKRAINGDPEYIKQLQTDYQTEKKNWSCF